MNPRTMWCRECDQTTDVEIDEFGFHCARCGDVYRCDGCGDELLRDGDCDRCDW